MQEAIQYIHEVPPRLVDAEEIARRFKGDIPKGISFECQYCARPVIVCSDGSPDDNRIHTVFQSRRRESPRPYFRHSKNDAFAQHCPYYQIGTGSETKTQPPSIPIFLRKSPQDSTFAIELGVRRRGRDLLQRLHDHPANMLVDGVPYNLATLVADRSATIPFHDPDFLLASRIHIPSEWQHNIGTVENCRNALLFTNEFGSNGGRRLQTGQVIHAGFDYYAVIPHRDFLSIQSNFDYALNIGTIPSCHGKLIVVQFRILWQSAKRDLADSWLVNHGYRLSRFDMETTALWPPQIHSNGIDEPLFLHSMQIYQAPFANIQSRTDDVDDTIDVHSLSFRYHLPDLRNIGLLCFGGHQNLTTEMESYCCFIRTSKYLPWNACMLGAVYPSELHLADPPLRENSTTAAAYDDNTVDVSHQVEPTPLRDEQHIAYIIKQSQCRGLAVAVARKHHSLPHMASRQTILAQYR